MTNPLVSAIVPVFNGEFYVARALDSILSQTYQAVESIVVDDGSTDGTGRILESYGDRVVRLSQANAGPATARNSGIARATGEFIAFLDADDLWHPEKIQRQMDCLTARREAGYSLVLVEHFWMPELAGERQRLADRPMARPVLGYLLGGMLARRPVFDLGGSFRADRAEDTDWFIRAGECGIVMQPVHEVLLYRRVHRGNLTRSHPRTGPAKLVDTLKASLDRRRSSGKAPVADRLQQSETVLDRQRS